MDVHNYKVREISLEREYKSYRKIQNQIEMIDQLQESDSNDNGRQLL